MRNRHCIILEAGARLLLPQATHIQHMVVRHNMPFRRGQCAAGVVMWPFASCTRGVDPAMRMSCPMPWGIPSILAAWLGTKVYLRKPPKKEPSSKATPRLSRGRCGRTNVEENMPVRRICGSRRSWEHLTVGSCKRCSDSIHQSQRATLHHHKPHNYQQTAHQSQHQCYVQHST